jgi:hypothetical protein
MEALPQSGFSADPCEIPQQTAHGWYFVWRRQFWAFRSANVASMSPPVVAAYYHAGGIIYVRDNPRLRERLKPEHVKNRLQGHWDSSAGLSFGDVHLNTASDVLYGQALGLYSHLIPLRRARIQAITAAGTECK